jgi:small conductance mechanosensitive channel
MEELWRRLEQNAEVYVGRLIGAIIILFVGILALRYLLAPLRRILERGRMESSAASFVTNTARAVLIIAIGIAMLQQLGMETASLVTVLAAGGLAVALSLQNTLTNFAAGLLLLFFRMVRVGDLIEAGGMRGRVMEILPFHVVLLADDNEVLTLPNSLLTGSGFRNLSAQPARRAQWTLPLRPGDDLGAAKAVLCDRLLADPRILKEPGPRAFVQEWADDKRVLAVQAWATVGNQRAVQEELLEALGQALEGLRQRAGAETRPG